MGDMNILRLMSRGKADGLQVRPSAFYFACGLTKGML